MKTIFAAVLSRTSFKYSQGRCFSLAILGYSEGVLQLLPLNARDLMQVVMKTIPLMPPHEHNFRGLSSITNAVCGISPGTLLLHKVGWKPESQVRGLYSHTHSCGG